MDLESLQKIGLTRGEIKVYQALLNLGECTKTKLAKESGISPSNIYDVTNRLVEKGIISKIEKNNISHFSPSSPKRLMDFINQKEEELKKERDIVNNIIPSLLMKYKKTEEDTKIQVFQGWKGLETIFEDLLSECVRGDKCYVFGASESENKEKADIFFYKYSKLREKRGIMTYAILNKTLKGREERTGRFLKSKNYNIRFLPQSTPAEIMMYKNVTCIIILTSNPLVIRVRGEDVVSSFKQYFDTLWEVASG